MDSEYIISEMLLYSSVLVRVSSTEEKRTLGSYYKELTHVIMEVDNTQKQRESWPSGDPVMMLYL